MAIGADSMGTVAQAIAGPQVDEAIAKKIEMITNNPFDAPPADESNENLKEVHSKIQRYLTKLDKLYAIAEPEKDADADTPKQYGKCLFRVFSLTYVSPSSIPRIHWVLLVRTSNLCAVRDIQYTRDFIFWLMMHYL